MKIRSGLIGAGGFGKVHCDQLKRLAADGRIDFVAAVIFPPGSEPEEEKILRAMGVEIFGNAGDFFRKMRGKLDWVCIPTGIALHAPMTVRALECGMNVLVEKPAAGSVGDVKKMIASRNASHGLFTAIGFQHLCAEEIHRIKRSVLSGKYGKLREISVCGLWPRNDAYYHRNSWAGKCCLNTGEKVLDSPVNNAFAHYLNLPLFLSGKEFNKSGRAKKIQAELYRARTELESFDTCALKIRTEENVDIFGCFTHASDVNRNPEIRIFCERGSALWKAGDFWEIRDGSGILEESGVCVDPEEKMFEAVADRLEGKDSFFCTPEIALEHTKVIECLHKKFQISPVAPEFTIRRKQDGQVVLKDIPEIFERCFETRTMPSEAFAPWGVRQAEQTNF